MERFRQDFPILKSGITYLDSAASSLTPEPVLEKMLEFYRQYRSNIERGIYQLSQRASEEYESVRIKVAGFINAKSESEVILTKNTTEGINIAASGLKWAKGDKIVTTLVEHHSNFVTWLRVRERFGVDVEVVRPASPMVKGLFNLDDFERAIDDRTKLVAVTHASNVLGSIMPVRDIAKIARENGAHLLVDGAQSVPHLKIDVRRMGCDILAFSGHKMCAPTGSGGLYVREDLIEEIEPLCVGGGAVVDAGLDYYQLKGGATRFEGGTPAIGAAIGLGAAIDYLNEVEMDNIEDHETLLTKRIYEGLTGIPGVEVYGPEPDRKVGITSFNLSGVNSHDVALSLDASSNILVRSGTHCAFPLTKEIIRKPGSVRASTYLYNTVEDVQKFILATEEMVKAQSK